MSGKNLADRLEQPCNVQVLQAAALHHSENSHVTGSIGFCRGNTTSHAGRSRFRRGSLYRSRSLASDDGEPARYASGRGQPGKTSETTVGRTAPAQQQAESTVGKNDPAGQEDSTGGRA